MQILRLRAQDRTAVSYILQAGIRDQARYGEFASATERAEFIDDEWKAQVASLKEGPEDWWIAVEGARVIGAMRMAYWTDSVLGQAASVVEIDVHPAHRNKGVGERLVAHAESLATDAGGVILYVGGFVANPALRLYRRLGFAESPESIRYNQGPDHVVLGKRIRPLTTE